MHPDLMREVLNQRAAERMEDARQTTVARALRKTLRQRDRAAAPDVLAGPIPDYVDGTFAGGRAAERPAGRASAAGRAAADRQ